MVLEVVIDTIVCLRGEMEKLSKSSRVVLCLGFVLFSWLLLSYLEVVTTNLQGTGVSKLNLIQLMLGLVE